MSQKSSIRDKDDLKIGLQLLKQYHLIDLIERKGLKREVESLKNNDDMREVLLNADWTDSELEELLDTIEDHQKESEPLGYYVKGVKGFQNEESLEDLQRRLHDEEAVLSNDRRDLEEEGFELDDEETDFLKGVYWTESTSYNLNPLRRLDRRQKTYDTSFELHEDDGILYIGASLQSKAVQLINKMEDKGLVTKDVGHDDLPEDANKIVNEFVDDLRESTRTNDPPLDHFEEGDSKLPASLRTYSVKMLTRDEKIESVSIDGKDIITDPEVQTIMNKRGGKVVKITGKFDYQQEPFEFSAGYDDNKMLGRLSVEKQDSPSGEPDIVDECLDFLADRYKEYYIDFD